jgi:hypothetical protein
MTKSIRGVVVAAALAAAAALPLAAQATTTSNAGPQHYSLETRLTDKFHAGEFDGTLLLTIYPSGIVQGFYRPYDGGYRSVTGGLNGENIWLDIGMMGHSRVIGTFKDGVLNTVAQIPGPDIYTFQSVQTTKPNS